MAAAMLFGGTACDDTLDINTDPLAATEANPDLVMPFTQVVWVHNRVSEIATRMNDVPQYFSASFASPRNGGTTSGTLTNNVWLSKYTDVIGNLELVKNDAVDAGTIRDNVQAMSIIIQATNYFELTLIWEKVPFTQALDAVTFPTPEFDDQQTVLEGVIDMYDEAITLIDNLPTETFDLSSADLIYGGDMDNWKRYANSMKLRAYMILRNKSNAYDADIATLVGQPLIETNDQAAIFQYLNSSGNESPFQQLLDDFGSGVNSADEFYFPSEELVDLMNDKNDPRREAFFSDADRDDTNGNQYVGSQVGFFGTGGTNSLISDDYIASNMPEFLFTPAEVDFYEAELMLLGVIPGGVSGADDKLREGVELAIALQDRNDVLTSTEISNYAASLTALSTLSTTEALEEVYAQQFIEGFMRPIEGWTHVRRTNFPELEAPSASSIATIIKRFTYPPSETGTNTNVPTGINVGDAMWFEN